MELLLLRYLLKDGYYDELFIITGKGVEFFPKNEKTQDLIQVVKLAQLTVIPKLAVPFLEL